MIPLNDGSEYTPLDSDIETWKKLYPAVDIRFELDRMAKWSSLPKNEEKRKTRRGITKFINTWLSKAQDEGGSKTNVFPFVKKEPTRARPIEDYGNFSCVWELGEAMIRAHFKQEGFKAPSHLSDYQPRFNLRGLIDAIIEGEPDEKTCYSAFWVTLVKGWNRQPS